MTGGRYNTTWNERQAEIILDRLTKPGAYCKLPTRCVDCIHGHFTPGECTCTGGPCGIGIEEGRVKA